MANGAFAASNRGVRGGAAGTHTGTKAQDYTSFVSAIDLVAASPTGSDVARAICVTSGAASTLEFVDASGNTVTITVPFDGWQIDCGARTITTNTDVTELVVIW